MMPSEIPLLVFVKFVQWLSCYFTYDRDSMERIQALAFGLFGCDGVGVGGITASNGSLDHAYSEPSTRSGIHALFRCNHWFVASHQNNLWVVEKEFADFKAEAKDGFVVQLTSGNDKHRNHRAHYFRVKTYKTPRDHHHAFPYPKRRAKINMIPAYTLLRSELKPASLNPRFHLRHSIHFPSLHIPSQHKYKHEK